MTATFSTKKRKNEIRFLNERETLSPIFFSLFAHLWAIWPRVTLRSTAHSRSCRCIFKIHVCTLYMYIGLKFVRLKRKFFLALSLYKVCVHTELSISNESKYPPPAPSPFKLAFHYLRASSLEGRISFRVGESLHRPKVRKCLQPPPFDVLGQ